MKNIFLVLINPNRRWFYDKQHTMNSVKLFFKFLSNHLHYLLIHADPSSVSKTRSINQSIHNASELIFNVVISDLRCYWPCLLTYILNYDVIPKRILQLNSSDIINNWIQESRFPTTSLPKSNHRFSIFLINRANFLVIWVYVKPILISYKFWTLHRLCYYLLDVLLKFIKNLRSSCWTKLLN